MSGEEPGRGSVALGIPLTPAPLINSDKQANYIYMHTACINHISITQLVD